MKLSEVQWLTSAHERLPPLLLDDLLSFVLFLNFLFLGDLSPPLYLLLPLEKSPLILHTEVDNETFLGDNLHVVQISYSK